MCKDDLRQKWPCDMLRLAKRLNASFDLYLDPWIDWTCLS
jgi:hypothetical protein